ncbi:MAG TPA: mechanosensitive ion channel family protein [Nitrospira sp.]|nr:mechanosensitive ion channel family protein [Nitrospira sp.]
MASHKISTCLLLASMLTSGLSLAETQTPVPSISHPISAQPTGAPVVFDEQTLFFIYDTIGAFTPQERAHAIAERLVRLANDPLVKIYPITAVDRETTSELVYGEMVVMAVTDRDAAPTGKTRRELAQGYAQKVQSSLVTGHEKFTLRSLIVNIGLAILDTSILVILLLLFSKIFPKIYDKIEAWQGTVVRAIKIQRVELLSSDQIAAALTGIMKTIRFAATATLLYIYLTSVLGIFPWTHGISMSLLTAVLSTLQAIGQAFTIYIPDVVSIVVIVIVTHYIIKLIHVVFDGVRRGNISFSGFYREWAEPTYKIIRFLVIVFATIACFPYIPGSQSEGFRGISVFLGLLISLGSAAAFGNIIAGVVLTYMRPFGIGDRVKIADTTGDVMVKTLLVTRIRTIKNVDVTIPNAMVLGSHLINFSACARDQGLILNTCVTISYDVPWRKIHELLIEAARATTHVLPKPESFVLQTALNDFYVTYEINAYTNEPNRMATIYAELHQNIQDKFHEAGVEIMSPHYAQIRDGNKTAIPDEYLPKTYRAPGIRIDGLGTLFGQAQRPRSGDEAPQS